jgi:hypothetical protein
MGTCVTRGTFGEDHRFNSRSPLVLNGRAMHSAERLCGSGDDLIVWHVAQVLSDVPAMPERVLKLAVPVAPEHFGQRLTNLCARRHRLREHHLSVSDVKGQHHRRAANRGRGEYPISGNSSAMCSRPSPIRNWTDINRPSGTGIRLTSSAPKASR